MVDPEKRIHAPLTFLAVDVRQAAVDIIEAVGALAVLGTHNQDAVKGQVREIEGCIAKATRAAVSYRRAVVSGRETLPRAEFDAEASAESSFADIATVGHALDLLALFAKTEAQRKTHRDALEALVRIGGGADKLLPVKAG